MTSWFHLSALGGLSVTGFVASVTAVWLLASRRRCLALSWCLLFGAALAVAAGSQVAFLGWGLGVQSLDFTGFSGHATRAAAVFPVALFLLLEKKGGWIRRGAVLAGALLGVGVAAARVNVGAHSPSEAVTGCVLGFATAGLFLWHARGRTGYVYSPYALLPGLLLSSLLLTYVKSVDAHQALTAVALKLSGQDRIFQRHGWRHQSTSYVPPCQAERVRFDYFCARDLAD